MQYDEQLQRARVSRISFTFTMVDSTHMPSYAVLHPLAVEKLKISISGMSSAVAVTSSD